MPTERERLLAELRQFAASMRSRNIHGAAPLMDLDLTIPQLRAIFLLAEFGSMPMSPMAQESDTTLSACSHLVDKLVRSGFVTRSTDRDDRRVVRCTLTERGRALAERLRQSIPFERQEFLDRLTVKELRIIVQAMTIFQRVMAELQAELSKSSQQGKAAD
ncbi:MAG: MarR family transcriptional regulator [Chloroflexi bacterium]|nr:MarR family transcriptional regulator [Chloroflexota bacterium]